jgi:chromosome segregation ATPase
MASRPISADSHRGGYPAPRYSAGESQFAGQELLLELDNLRSENAQLRQLCGELEQALQEAASSPPDEERLREYEALLEEKTETIRQLHQQLQDAQAAFDQADNQPGPARQGPVPREDELLQLSEELERERRQLQEDEQSLMDQMRQMELSMARERAEMARQRNDLQRLYGEIRHELERLERNGALQNKMDELKSKLQDAATRRGAAPGHGGSVSTPSAASPQPEHPGQQPSAPRGSVLGRLFGGK